MESPRKQMAILKELAQAVMSSVPCDEAFQMFASRTAECLGAKTVLAFWPEQDGSLLLRATSGGEMPVLRLPLTTEWAQETSLHEQVVLANDIQADTPGSLEFTELAAWKPHSLMCAPIRRLQKPAGVMVAIDRLGSATFDEESLTCFSTLAEWAAVGLAKVQLEAEVELLKQEKTDFVSLVSHELRVPMTSIKGYAKLLGLGTAGSMSDSQKQFLDTITRNVNRMDRLVSVLLDLSRLEARRIVPDLQVVSLKSMVEESVQKIAGTISQKEMKLEVDIPPGLPLAYADPNKVVQIMDNLLSNACLYTPAGGAVSISACSPASNALVRDDERDAFIEVQIIDNGIGIAEEDNPKIFNRFFRGDHPLVQESAGTGFGLMVTKLLVELLHGRIGFVSQLGQGSQFTLVLPIAKSHT